MGGEDALGSDHAGQVVRGGLPTNENGVATLSGSLNSVGSGEDNLAHGSARACVQTASEHIVVGVLIELRMEELIELRRLDAADCLFLGDEAFLLHVDGNLKSGSSGTLANAGLEHPELALLDGELDVHHVAEVVLKDDEHLFELGAGLLKAFDVLELGNGAGVADAGDDVLALSVDQVVAIEFLGAVSRVAGEGNARSRRVALVAEDHALNVDCGAHVVVDLVLLTVKNGAGVVPAAKDRLDGVLQLNHGVLRELNLAVNDKSGVLVGVDVLAEDLLELANEFFQILRGEVGVGSDTAGKFHGVDGVLEHVAVKTHDDVGEHLDETTIRVPSETRVLGLLDEAVDGCIVQTQVQNGVHHARHGDGSAGTNGNQQRILGVADLLANALLEVFTVLMDGFESALGPHVACVRVLHAGLARDGESRRDRQADVCHLGEVGTLTAQLGLHVGVALGHVVALCVLAEAIDAFDCFSHLVLLSDQVSGCNRVIGANAVNTNTFILPQIEPRLSANPSADPH